MAEVSREKPDFMTDFLFVQETLTTCLGERYEECRGFRRDYLNRELSELESLVTTCPKCKGILRKAVVTEGEMTCWDCCSGMYAIYPLDQIRHPIAKLEIKCPLLRDCSWTGLLCEAETHLAVCGKFKIFCPNECGTVIKRCENVKHMEEECIMREVPCNFCNIPFAFQLLDSHLEICSLRLIQCTCGDKYTRLRLAMHIETECPLAELECPYAKYSCHIGKMQRKDMLAHKQDFYIEHQDMLERESMLLKNEIQVFQVKVILKRNIEFVEWKVPNILTLRTYIEGPNISIDSSKFKCTLSTTNMLNIGIRKFQSNRTADLLTALFQLRLSPRNNLDEPYTAEISVGIGNVGNTVYTLFTIDKETCSSYIQEDDSIVFKICYCLENSNENSRQIFTI